MHQPPSVDFSASGQWALNGLLAFLMFSVALGIDLGAIVRSFRNPKALLSGFVAQAIVLPALTFALVSLINPEPHIALGLILVAACPGGNVSNYISALAKADIELSVSLTATSTLLSVVLTPLNFAFWAGLYRPTSGLMRSLDLGFFEMLQTIGLLLFIPIVLAVGLKKTWPKLVDSITTGVQWAAGLMFSVFVVLAVAKNWPLMSQQGWNLIGTVSMHNALAFGSGAMVALVVRLKPQQIRTVTIETGIQNAGLGLVLALKFMPEFGQVAVVAAIWGVWHLIGGSALALLMRHL